MDNVIFSFSLFFIIYLIYLVTVIRNPKKVDALMGGNEVLLMKRKHNLSMSKFSNKYIANIIALTNSFIISVTFFAISFIDSFWIKFIIAFVILVPFIFGIYYIIGYLLKKREG